MKLRRVFLIAFVLAACISVGAQKPELVVEQGHTAWAASVATGPDGRTLASPAGKR
ncbi:MAG TPA: hypothetical protein VEH50_13465 [Methylomirabilota bacterium]|nr:hypothetical protein [Methylomirabilota bacterium]